MQTETREPTEAIIEAIRARRLLVFCGAGISLLAPSKAPSWWDIYVAAARALADRLAEVLPTVHCLLPKDLLLGSLSTQQLADLIIERFAGATFAELLKAVDVADANENHRAIASLAARGGLRAVLTTNFDTMIERAGVVRGSDLTVVTPSVGFAPGENERCPLIKLHGSTVDPAGMLEASWQKAGEVSSFLIEAWLARLDDADLLVVGYSGADLNFGASRAFFADFLAHGARVFWLHLPGDPPVLPAPLQARTTLIPEALPYFFRALLSRLDEFDFETPLTGRDAHRALTRAMQSWSRALHVGGWGAATFFLELAERARENPAASGIRRAMILSARELALQFEPGASIESDHAPLALALAVFLGAAGGSALRHIEVDDATSLARASLNIFATFHQALSSREGSANERHRNLATAWNRYAMTRILRWEIPEALGAFRQSNIHSYSAGDPAGFLVGLIATLNVGFELKAVRRCMRYVEAAVELADRLGLIGPSIELRFLLAFYACDRNEVWTAREWLREARHRAQGMGSEVYARVAEIQLGECALRSGQLREGLELIATKGHDKRAFLYRSVEETRRYLVRLGIPQPTLFAVEVSPERIPELVALVEAERAAARASEQLPWKGEHCRVSESSFFAAGYGEALFSIGCREFEGEAERAVELGLELAEQLLTAAEFVDAAWVASNALLNPGCSTRARTRAHAVLARCAAALGRLAEVERHLDLAAVALSQADLPLPVGLAETGMWYAIQCGDVTTAVRWTKAFASATIPGRSTEAQIALARVQTWGPSFAVVSELLRSALMESGAAEPLPVVSAGDRFRLFRGQGTPDARAADAGTTELLRSASELVQRKEFERALAALEHVSAQGALPECQAAFATTLHFLSIVSKCSPAEVEPLAQSYREGALAQLTLVTLSCVERAVALALLHAGLTDQAIQSLRCHAWIGELADDSLASAALLAMEAELHVLGGATLSRRQRHALRLSAYFGIDALASASAETIATGAEPAMDLVVSTHEVFERVLWATTESTVANQALGAALAQLREGGRLTQSSLRQLIELRALWALRVHQFEQAARDYRRIQRGARREGVTDEATNAMGGEARALSRAGAHYEAIELFTRAASEARDDALRSNLLVGLGMAGLRWACVAEESNRARLLDDAIAALERAVALAAPATQDRAFARIAWARCLAEAGQQEAGLETVDEVISELAHLGHQYGRVLMGVRGELAAGNWNILVLD